MKKIIWTLYILLIAIVQKAQIPEVNWGQKSSVKGIGKSINYAPIGHTKDYYFVRNRTKKYKELIQYDFNNKLIKSTPLAFQYKGDDVDMFKIINTASGNYLIGVNHEKKQKKTYVHTTTINLDGSIEKELTHLYAYDYKKSNSMTTGDTPNKDAFGFKLSPDSTKVLCTNITSNKDHRKRKYKEQYFIRVFDAEMKKVWEKNLELQEADRDIEIEQFEITNDGTVYLLAKINARGRSEK